MKMHVNYILTFLFAWNLTILTSSQFVGFVPSNIVENQPPITNRPVTYSPGPVDGFQEDEPTLEIGPDEDDMTSVEKRRYFEIAERMCDKYKSLNTKKIVAIPLLPSAHGVEVNVSDCTPIKIPLIIGGQVATIEEFPHMALIGWKNAQDYGYSWKCGGSLISDEYVLTAGHCTYQEKDYSVISGTPRAVQLGSARRDDRRALILGISTVIRHPKYKRRRSYYDLALVKLVSKVRFSDQIRPACLGVPPAEGERVVVSGWGRTEFGGDASADLRSVSVEIWNMQECRETWGTSLKLPNGPTPDSHVCAGERKGGKDTCQGDSGGPAQVEDGCVWRVVAVTSIGRSCAAPQTPALYSRLQIPFIIAPIFGNQPSYNQNDHQTNQNQNNNDRQTNPNRYDDQQENRNRPNNQHFNNNFGFNSNNNFNGQTIDDRNQYYNQNVNNQNKHTQNSNNQVLFNQDHYNAPSYDAQDHYSSQDNQYNNQYQQDVRRPEVSDNRQHINNVYVKGPPRTENFNFQNDRIHAEENYQNNQGSYVTQPPEHDRPINDYNNQKTDYNNQYSDYNNQNDRDATRTSDYGSQSNRYTEQRSDHRNQEYVKDNKRSRDSDRLDYNRGYSREDFRIANWN